MNEPINLLDACKTLFHDARNRVSEAMPLLHKIFKEGLWEGQYSSFGEYADECQISRSYASRLITVFEHYSIQGGISQLNEVDPDRLYLALQLPGTAEERYEKARVLSRQEIRSEAKSSGGEHECESIQICKHCGKRM